MENLWILARLPQIVKGKFTSGSFLGARHTLQRKARSRRVDVGNAYPAKSQLEGAVRDGSHN